MTNVKIGNKTYAFPADMNKRDLEKAIKQLQIDFAVDALKDFKAPKPFTFGGSRNNKKKGGRVMKARGGRITRRK